MMKAYAEGGPGGPSASYIRMSQTNGDSLRTIARRTGRTTAQLRDTLSRDNRRQARANAQRESVRQRFGF